jgi:hypothetical protein
VSAANYRARSATELVDGAVQLLRANLSTFVTLGAVFYVPVLVIQWTLIGTLRPPTVGSPQIGAFYGRFMMVYPFFVIWTAAWYTVIFTVASDVYLGRAADIGSAVNRGLTRIVPTLAVSILKAIGVGIACVFFLIPGIFLALYWFATPAAVILEPIGVLASFARSGVLSRGQKGHVFKAYLIAFCIFIAAYFLMILIGGILGVLARFISPAASTTITMVIIAIGMMFIYPLWPILSTLLYYDARIRSEGFDIELMARGVATAGAAATA